MKISYKNFYLFLLILYSVMVGLDRFFSGGMYVLIGVFSVLILLKSKSRFAIYFLVCLFFLGGYAVLSYLGYISNPWGRYYSNETMFRQVIIYIIFVLAVAASSACWKSCNIRHYNISAKVVLFYYLMAVSSEYLFIYALRDDEPAHPIFIGGLNNAEFVFISFFAFWLLFFVRNILLRITSLLVAFLLCANSQSQLVIMMLAVLLFFPQRILLISTSLVVLIGFVFFSIYNPFFFDDYNTTIRALYWRDAIYTIFEYDLYQGVGFGSEWVKNWYPNSSKIEMFEDGTSEMINTGLHNSIVSIFFRLGFFGLVLIFIGIYILAINSIRCNFKTFLFLMTSISIWVNVGLESPLFNVSIALAWGYILSADRFYVQAKK